jgi:hypothetical protein
VSTKAGQLHKSAHRTMDSPRMPDQIGERSALPCMSLRDAVGADLSPHRISSFDFRPGRRAGSPHRQELWCDTLHGTGRSRERRWDHNAICTAEIKNPFTSDPVATRSERPAYQHSEGRRIVAMCAEPNATDNTGLWHAGSLLTHVAAAAFFCRAGGKRAARAAASAACFAALPHRPTPRNGHAASTATPHYRLTGSPPLRLTGSPPLRPTASPPLCPTASPAHRLTAALLLRRPVASLHRCSRG